MCSSEEAISKTMKKKVVVTNKTKAEANETIK